MVVVDHGDWLQISVVPNCHIRHIVEVQGFDICRFAASCYDLVLLEAQTVLCRIFKDWSVDRDSTTKDANVALEFIFSDVDRPLGLLDVNRRVLLQFRQQLGILLSE